MSKMLYACIMIVCMYRRAGSTGSTTYACMPACMHILCMCATDWRGAGFTRGLAVPRGTRDGAGRSHAYFCGAVQVRAYDIDCGAGAGPCAASAGMYSLYAVQCPMFYIAFNFVIENMFPFIKGFHKEMIC